MIRFAAGLPRAIIALACVFLLGSCRDGDGFNFNQTLDEVDAYLASGAAPHAANLLEDATEHATTVEQWMRLTKRAYSVSIAAADWKHLSAAARAASNDLPGNTEFRAMATFAHLRMGDVEKAYAISREYLDGSDWQLLADEVFLARGSSRSDADGLERLKAYSSEFGREEAEFIREAAHRLRDPRLFLDAALIHAGSGDIGEAGRLGAQFARDIPVPAAYIAYDVGDAEEALIGFARAAHNTLDYRDALVYADALYSFGDYARAREMSGHALEIAPEQSWIPYANTAMGFVKAGDLGQAREVLDTARALFPESLPVAVRSVLLRDAAGETNLAAGEFESLRTRHPGAPETAYLEYELRSTASSRIRFASALKEAFYANPDESSLARNTAAVLANDRNFTELELILDAYERVMPRTEWSIFYRGLLAVEDGRLEDALSHFDTANELDPRWEYVHNRGVLLMGQRKYDDAREAFRRASAMPIDPASKAAIAVLIARTFLLQGNVTAATREATYAADMYPENTEARLLLRELEARTE